MMRDFFKPVLLIAGAWLATSCISITVTGNGKESDNLSSIKNKQASSSEALTPKGGNSIAIRSTNNPKDIRISSLHTNIVTAAYTPLVAWTWDGVPGTSRQLLNFNIPTISPSAKITRATLTLYPLETEAFASSSGTNNSFYIRQITSEWSLSNVSWANQPATTTSNQVLIPHNPLITSEPIAADVTNMVKYMVNTGKNYGFMLLLDNEVRYTSRIFCSSWHKDEAKHPCLTIEYEY